MGTLGLLFLGDAVLLISVADALPAPPFDAARSTGLVAGFCRASLAFVACLRGQRGALADGTHGDAVCCRARDFCWWRDGFSMFRRPVGELLVTRLSPVAADDVPTLQEGYG